MILCSNPSSMLGMCPQGMQLQTGAILLSEISLFPCNTQSDSFWTYWACTVKVQEFVEYWSFCNVQKKERPEYTTSCCMLDTYKNQSRPQTDACLFCSWNCYVAHKNSWHHFLFHAEELHPWHTPPNRLHPFVSQTTLVSSDDAVLHSQNDASVQSCHARWMLSAGG